MILMADRSIIAITSMYFFKALKLCNLLRDLSEISRGEGVKSGGGSHFFQLSKRGGSDKIKSP